MWNLVLQLTYRTTPRKVDMDMAKNNCHSFSHLTLDERRIILIGITNGSTKTAIAQIIQKDKSTLGKEVKLHRKLTHKCKLSLECNHYRKCVHGRHCSLDCPDYSLFHCSRRDRSPGACNGCSNWSHCRFDKYQYFPEEAHSDYLASLVDSRQGFNLTYQEAKRIADIIAPLLKKGHSPYQIIANHPELNISEKTLYNYIENDVFHHIAGITVMDLRRKVSRKISKKKSNSYKKRADNQYLKGRTFKDYQDYISEDANVFVTQMDTVYNDESHGPFIQTFKLLKTEILIALYHDTKTATSMKEGVDILEEILSPILFRKYVNVLLTDRGTEFSAAVAMETSPDGSRRTRVFYCDPMQSGQKGSLENKHIVLRYILPKGTDLKALGLDGQSTLNVVISHINSAPLESLNGKSPLDYIEFMYPDLYERLIQYGIEHIDKDNVILKPYLLKIKK